MTVNFYCNALAYTGGEKTFEPKRASSVRELADELGCLFGEAFKGFLLGGNTCFFLVNGKGIMTTGGLDTKLLPGDKIEILPVVDGG